MEFPDEVIRFPDQRRFAVKSLTGLRLFVAIVERGTLAAAADRLALSQPAASRQLALLEDELGLRLFERRRQRLVATDEALAFYAEARHVIAAVDDVPHAVERIRSGAATPLRLIAMPKLAHTLLAEAIVRFGAPRDGTGAGDPSGVSRGEGGSGAASAEDREDDADAARVDIALESRARVEMERGLASGRFHLGFGSLPVASDAFDIEPLCTAPLHVVVPAGHPPPAPGTLPALPYVALWRRSPIRERIDQFLAARGERRDPEVEVSTAALAVALVAAGRGFTVMDTFGIDDARRPHVALSPLPEGAAVRYAVLRAARGREHPAAGAFVEVVRKVCEARLRR